LQGQLLLFFATFVLLEHTLLDQVLLNASAESVQVQ
jgi:hypothetical protein